MGEKNNDTLAGRGQELSCATLKLIGAARWGACGGIRVSPFLINPQTSASSADHRTPTLLPRPFGERVGVRGLLSPTSSTSNCALRRSPSFPRRRESRLATVGAVSRLISNTDGHGRPRIDVRWRRRHEICRSGGEVKACEALICPCRSVVVRAVRVALDAANDTGLTHLRTFTVPSFDLSRPHPLA